MSQVIKSAFAKLYTDFYSLSFITDNGKKKHELKLRKIYVIVAVFVILLSISLSILMTTTNQVLSSDLNTNKHNLEELNSYAENQKNEIETLEKEFVSINEKLSSYSDLEEEIRDIVGLDKEESLNIATIQVSRSGGLRTASGAAITQLAFTPDDFHSEAEIVNNQLDEKLVEMNDLVVEVEEKLRFLEAYPDRWPASGYVSSGYGYRNHPITGRREFHAAIDIANSSNTTIRASGAGKVTFSGYYGGYGYCVIIDHGYGYKTLYAHNRSITVKKGEYVVKGQAISKMGRTGTATGNHVHFEVIKNGKKINPYNTLK